MAAIVVFVNYVAAIVVVMLSAFSSLPQSGVSDSPLRTAPTEKFTVNPAQGLGSDGDRGTRRSSAATRRIAAVCLPSTRSPAK